MKDFVDEQVGDGGYVSPSGYFQALLLEEQKRKAEQKLEELLRQGLASRTAALDEKEWEDIRGELESPLASGYDGVRLRLGYGS